MLSSFSLVPLWWKTKAIIQEESKCQSGLADAAILSGYIEGGYARVVVASALDRLGVETINVQSGGAHYRLASEAVLGIVESIDDGTFSSEALYILALLEVPPTHRHMLRSRTTRKTKICLTLRRAN